MNRSAFSLVIITFIILTTSIPAQCMGYDARSFNDEGVALTLNGTYDRAIAKYDLALVSNPDSLVALENKAAAQFLLGDYDGAIITYDHILKLQPESPLILTKKGIALEKKGDYGAAIETYDRALMYLTKYISNIPLNETSELNGSTSTTSIIEELGVDESMILYHKAKSLEGLGRNEEAIQLYEQFIEIQLEHSTTLYEKGLNFAEDFKSEQAIALYDEALQADPDNTTIWYSRGQAYDSLGLYEEAIVSYDKVIEFGPTM